MSRKISGRKLLIGQYPALGKGLRKTMIVFLFDTIACVAYHSISNRTTFSTCTLLYTTSLAFDSI